MPESRFTWRKYLRSTAFNYIPRSLSLVWTISRPLVVGILILTLGSAVIPLAIAYVAKLIIDAVVSHSAELATYRVLLELGLVFLQVIVFRALCVLRGILGSKLSVEINCLILSKSAELELSQIEDSSIQDKLNRAWREASSRPVSMTTDTFQVVQNLLTLLGYVTLLFAFNKWAVFVLVFAALPAAIAEMRFSTSGFRLHNWRSPERRRLSYLELLLVNESYAKEVRVLNLAKLFIGRFRTLGEKLYREDRDLVARRGLWAALLSLLALGAFYGFYAVMVRHAAIGSLTLGNLTLYVMALRQGQQAFQSCLSAVGNLYEHNLYMSNLFEFLSVPIKSRVKESMLTVLPDRKTGIHFHQVSFRYPGQESWALRDIELKIFPGQSVAIVGYNGAGKTTLIKLLCRLYEPTEGEIFLDDLNLKEWTQEDLTQRMSVVFQDFSRYHLTLGENIGVGDRNHLDDEAKILSAIKQGGALEIYEKMPLGLKTQLGRYFNGVELSGGQWQRIALSRSFVKDGAEILILDEPTAALDAQAEYALLESFRHLTRGKTSVIISHHFPVARLAERIVVIEDGQIIEEGSHDSLLLTEGLYARLFTLQAKGYH